MATEIRNRQTTQEHSKRKYKFYERMSLCISAAAGQVRIASARLSCCGQPPAWSQHTFLPRETQKKSLGVKWKAWESALSHLPTLFTEDRHLRSVIRGLPRLDLGSIAELSDVQRWKAMQVVSFVSHAYVWGPPGASVETKLPTVLAEPWWLIGRLLDVPAVMSYATFILLNCQSPSTNPADVKTVHSFTGTPEEEWFVAIHISIEAMSETLISNVFQAKRAAAQDDAEGAAACLYEIAGVMSKAGRMLHQMREKCPPAFFKTIIRRVLSGWNKIQGGLTYEGIGGGMGFYGASGVQSSAVHLLDAFLGVRDASEKSESYLEEIRGYMPQEHRQIVRKAKEGESIRAFAERRNVRVGEAYNACIREVRNFRWSHIRLVKEYVLADSRNMKVKGTGGTTDALHFLRHNALLTHSKLFG